MDASSRRMFALLAEMNSRYVIPVYQRAYSWDVEQCARLLDDARGVGGGRDETHFTGSIVTIQDGSVSAQGVAPQLVIDGQQRLTTVSLLLVALARYDRAHPGRVRSYTHDEIACGGLLTNHYRTGEDHYKLTLSKGDHEVFAALVDELCGVGSAPAGPSRLLDNLGFFERAIEDGEDADRIWAGLRRLEVVAIRLAQGQDKPQVIFESMNSTGKDLSPADLVRNFVLMSYPIEEQDEVYRVFWAPIERTLGTHAYEGVFDDFIRCYLTVASPLASWRTGDAYQMFKRYVVAGEWRREDRMRILVLRLARFAGYYAAVTAGAVEDGELARALARIERLVEPGINPLLLALFDRHEHGALPRARFLEALGLVESYLLRRAVCGCDAESLVPFVASLVARMDAAAEEGADVAVALEVALVNEAHGAARFPTDAEFSLALASLAQRRSAVEEAEGEADDAGFDVLALIEADERMATGNSGGWDGACGVWARPELDEATLATHRSTAQAQARNAHDDDVDSDVERA